MCAADQSNNNRQSRRGFYGRVIAPRILNSVCGIGPITRQRQKVVPQASGVVLEVGIGTGLNMPHYDAGKVTRVIGVDPDADITALAAARADQAPFPVEVITDTGEALPLEDNLADSAVLTYTLCSIPDAAAALLEIRRVLKPTGRILFAEHGRSKAASVARWQDRLNPAWKVIAGGCNLNRDTERLLQEAGFRLEQSETFALEKVPEVVGFHYVGTARPR